MFCNKCGKEINDEAVVCIHCGCAVNGAKKPAPEDNRSWDEVNKSISVGMRLLIILIPIVGLILGLVELCGNNDSKQGLTYLSCFLSGCVAWGITIGAIIAATYLA